jgi:hypothetical protein
MRATIALSFALLLTRPVMVWAEDQAIAVESVLIPNKADLQIVTGSAHRTTVELVAPGRASNRPRP